MRLLLVAYEFPPGQSPRALRWGRLARELASAGHEVHVLAPRLGDAAEDDPAVGGGVRVHRTYAGPLMGTLASLRARRRGPAGARTVAAATGAAPRLNYRGRVATALKQLAGLALFPDVRAEWNPWARRALFRLLRELRPDVVVTSHEPASTLPLGRAAKRAGFAWAADLGDPVCAPYTPRRWRRRAWRLEARVAAEADLLVVTNAAMRELMQQRHDVPDARCLVLPQGYDVGRAPARGARTPGSDTLELLYTGRLYGFRSATALMRAVACTDGVRLTLVLADATRLDAGAVQACGDRLRVLGPLDHERVLAMQTEADLLVSFGNRGLPAQVPGKLFEYMGAGVPILHVRAGPDDAAARLLEELGIGWLCEDDERALAQQLPDLRLRRREGRLDTRVETPGVRRYALPTLARELASALAGIADRAAGASSPLAQRGR